ncbi:LOW QUALITY PROTEIN: Helitron helicase [Phytophthora megakarya]|uniref:Helitron helicase n=1 Tax=Phytophthora megakarya TaxID=4795 RepID=A0A225V7Q9_9STRA|nr:LOW QUALITY PROTEIN: Helitron helicase [Phytophthora megakarya]
MNVTRKPNAFGAGHVSIRKDYRTTNTLTPQSFLEVVITFPGTRTISRNTRESAHFGMHGSFLMKPTDAAVEIDCVPTARCPIELRRFYQNPGFKQLIRANKISSFTSMGSSRFRPLNVDESITQSRSGCEGMCAAAWDLYYLLPTQVYINDPDMQARVASRMGMTDGLGKDILETIDQVMTTHNPYSQQFMNARNLLIESAGPEYQAAVEKFACRDRAGEARPEDNPELRLHEFLPEDENFKLRLHVARNSNPGWTLDLPYAVTSDNPNIGSISLREYESYLPHDRADSDSLILKAGRLTQQYCVDQWAKCEQSRLRYIEKNQLLYRLETLQGLTDAL